MRAPSVLLSLLLILPACIEAGPVRPDPRATPEGPPRIQAGVLERHADQFQTDLAERAPGSQEEFAAAAYLTAHLQQAAYVVRLEDVPVADTVRSSDVIALAPSGGDPTAVVTVSYGTSIGAPDLDAGDIGAFLELARALRVALGEHDLEFVALGAQSDDMLGARRLAQLLLDSEVEPRIVHLASTEQEARLVAPLEQAGFEVETLVGAGEEIASDAFARLSDADG